ncbi:hypothetical protein CPC08DRAFT_766917 [Agrocybe pediades]|nr:hypothetical protein CPC08DRAFT_766917 [Agrocybe pediades]
MHSIHLRRMHPSSESRHGPVPHAELVVGDDRISNQGVNQPSDNRDAAIQSFLHEYYSKEMSRRTTRLAAASKEIISSSEGRVNSINSLAVVISFIAVVQSTIILLSVASDDSALARITNTLSFVGLVLDITGSLTGLAHAFHLQHVIKKETKILGVISEFEGDVKSISDWLTSHLKVSGRAPELETTDGLGHDHTLVSSLPIEEILRRTKEEMQSFYEEDERRQAGAGSVHDLLHSSSHSQTRLGDSKMSFPFRLLMDIFYHATDGGVAQFGSAPIRAMVLGSLCLLVSTVLLAARDLKKETWITSLVVGLVVYQASMLAELRHKIFGYILRKVGVIDVEGDSQAVQA